MKLKIYKVDAFTDELFSGNYAAVVILDDWIDAKLMQSIATENNLSETAFIKNVENNNYEIRWFSPLNEIDFCGHATLASAYALFDQNNSLERLSFTAKEIGTMSINKTSDNYIHMTFPKQEPKLIDEIPKELLSGLSIVPAKILRNRQAYFAIYDNEEDVYNIKVDLDAIKKLKPYDLVVSAKSEKYDFVSRYFWPGNGEGEDFVTGSIHTGLTPFWAKILKKDNLLAYQASSRGGVLRCEVKEDKVIVSGKAILYLEGWIYV